MLLIWGFEQVRRPAAQWHDGQFTHDTHAQIARRAKWRFTPSGHATRMRGIQYAAASRFRINISALR